MKLLCLIYVKLVFQLILTMSNEGTTIMKFKVNNSLTSLKRSDWSDYYKNSIYIVQYQMFSNYFNYDTTVIIVLVKFYWFWN